MEKKRKQTETEYLPDGRRKPHAVPLDKNGKPKEGHYLGSSCGFSVEHIDNQVRYNVAPVWRDSLIDLAAEQDAINAMWQTFQRTMQDAMIRISKRIQEQVRAMKADVGLPAETLYTYYYKGYLVSRDEPAAVNETKVQE